MWRLILNISLLFIFVNSFTQRIVTVTGSSQMELSDYKTRKQVERDVEELAIVDALEKAFGKVIVQGNSTFIQNINTGEKVQSNSIFNMIANSTVKGEVIEIIKKDYSEIEGYKVIDNKKEKIIYLKCDIKIKAKEIIEPPIEFEAFPLACDNPKCEKTDFNEDEDLFFYFRSPVEGYLTIYLDDGNVSQLLLPYKLMPEELNNTFPIEPNKDYILFSNKAEHNYFDNNYYEADTYQLFAENPVDLCRFFILFSFIPLNNPKFNENINYDNLSETEIMQGYTMPKTLPSEDFQRWLIKTRSDFKNDLQVKYIDITIKKK